MYCLRSSKIKSNDVTQFFIILFLLVARSIERHLLLAHRAQTFLHNFENVSFRFAKHTAEEKKTRINQIHRSVDRRAYIQTWMSTHKHYVVVGSMYLYAHESTKCHSIFVNNEWNTKLQLPRSSRIRSGREWEANKQQQQKKRKEEGNNVIKIQQTNH